MAEPKIKKRKKVCPKCGRELWLRDFYKDKNGNRYGACKECKRKLYKQKYAQKRKKPDGVFYDEKEGRLMEHRGNSKRIYWTGNMLSILKRYFPNTKANEISEMIGVSSRTVMRKASELGLKKSEEFMRRVQKENLLLANAATKNFGVANAFTKGHIPWNKGLKILKEL